MLYRKVIPYITNKCRKRMSIRELKLKANDENVREFRAKDKAIKDDIKVYSYSATQQESRFFSRVACRLVFFHRSQKTPRRHTKTFCLASTAIVHKVAYKYVCIDDAH